MHPAWKLSQVRGKRLVQERVAGVEEPVDLAVREGDGYLSPNAQRLSDATKAWNGNAVQVASLDQRYHAR